MKSKNPPHVHIDSRCVPYAVVYLPMLPQEGAIDWQKHTSYAISRFVPTVFFHHNKTLHFLDLFSARGIKQFLIILEAFIRKKQYISLMEIEFAPSNKFSLIRRVNERITFYFVCAIISRLRAWGHRIVMVCPPFDHLIPMITYIKPDLVIGDYTDKITWASTKVFLNTYRLLCANSEAIKSQKANITKIPAGYFSKQNIELLYLQNKGQRNASNNTVICITGINARVDYLLLAYLITHLKQHVFYFYHANVFESDVLSSDHKTKTQALLTKKAWEQIQTHPNVISCPIRNLEDLTKYNIPKGVGIIPYKTDCKFNQFSNPIKYYIYLLLGMPIVSTPLYNIEKHQNSDVRVSYTYKEFAAAIRNFNGKLVPRSRIQKYYNMTLRNTFEKKAEALYHFILSNLT